MTFHFISKHPGAAAWFESRNYENVIVQPSLERHNIRKGDVVLGSISSKDSWYVHEIGAEYWELVLSTLLDDLPNPKYELPSMLLRNPTLIRYITLTEEKYEQHIKQNSKTYCAFHSEKMFKWVENNGYPNCIHVHPGDFKHDQPKMGDTVIGTFNLERVLSFTERGISYYSPIIEKNLNQDLIEPKLIKYTVLSENLEELLDMSPLVAYAEDVADIDYNSIKALKENLKKAQ